MSACKCVTLIIVLQLCLISIVQSLRYGYSLHNINPFIKKKATIAELIKQPNTPIVLSQPPCCQDLIGTLACRRLKKNNFGLFLTRCEQDPDFSLATFSAFAMLFELQWFWSGIRETSQLFSRRNAKTQFMLTFEFQGEKSKYCFDRHSPGFCQAFLMKRDIWTPTLWSCTGDHAQLAWRICRKTCGYCRPDLYSDERLPVPPVPFPPSFFKKQKCQQFI
ncbi:hypothetical protein M3Y96_00206700 [Aphelenchoides besseyi]|nr:hypothetical protein M3Y96_00206700 [Aphelenchoides besseyi]